LIEQAESRQLYEHPYWLSLLHFPGRPSRYSLPRFAEPASEILSRDFFLATGGRRDPRAELAATLHGFFENPGDDTNSHPQCRFPARFTWLRSKLSWPVEPPLVECPGFQAWSQQGEVDSISLVLVSGYFGNPASFYGHLLLKFNTEDSEPSNGLLDPSLSYGAIDPDLSNVVLYVVKGLLGGYDAGFSHERFYRYDHQYAQEQLRDLWEYELELSALEVEQLVAHSWELLGNRFAYYFLDSNCATQMARLLGLVIEEPLLSEALPWHIPSTLFDRLARLERNGLPMIREIQLIPSRQRTLREHFSQLEPMEKETLALWVANPGNFDLTEYQDASDTARVRIVETLANYYAFRSIGNEADESIEANSLAVLRERLRLPMGGWRPEPRPIAPPHAGQPPGLVRASSFYNSRLDTGFELRLRAAYFDHLSPDAGTSPDSALSMLDATLAFADDRVWLRRFDFIELENLNPSRTGLPGDGGMAWRFGFGLKSVDRSCVRCTVVQVGGGLGKSFALSGRVTTFGMLDAQLQSPRFETRKNNLQLVAARPRLGLVAELLPGWKAIAEVGYQIYLDGEDTGEPIISVQQRFGTSRRWDLRVSYEEHVAREGKLDLSWYW